LVGIGPLRRTLTKQFVNALWASTVERGVEGDRACPVCANPMVRTDTGDVAVDVCRRCQVVWFDPREFESAPQVVVQREPKFTDEQLEPIARMQVEEIAREWRHRPRELSAEDLMMVPAALGLPLEEEATVVNRLPLVTWGLAAVMFVLGSFFFDVGLFLLFTNLYFLVVFGDNVEDFLGRLNYVSLIIVAALVGAGVHAAFSPASLTPSVWASAAIAGIVVFYGFRFPQAKLRYFRLFRWFSMPALAATGFWIVTQLIAARTELSGAGDVPALAYIGGAVAGLAFWFMWRND
jgi:membrane associated rhomboid family serine protease/Zn-finger nucleic acid-binding protein